MQQICKQLLMMNYENSKEGKCSSAIPSVLPCQSNLRPPTILLSGTPPVSSRTRSLAAVEECNKPQHQVHQPGVSRSSGVHPVPGAGCDGGGSTQVDDAVVMVNSVQHSELRLECLESLEVLENHLEASNAQKVDGQCWGCLVTFKGSRGLKAHLAKSKTCKLASNNSLVSRHSVPVQSSNSNAIVAPEPGVSGPDPVAPGDSSESQRNKCLIREEEAASLRAEDEVRLPIKWPVLKEKAKWSDFQSAVLAKLPSADAPWTDHLESLQNVIYSVAKDMFGCIQPRSTQRPRKNRRQVKLDMAREELRMLLRRRKVAPQDQLYGLDCLIEEKKRERNGLRRAENARKRRVERRKLRTAFYQNPFKAAKDMLSPKVVSQLDVPKPTLDNYVRDVASDPQRDVELGDLDGLPDVPAPKRVLSNRSFSFRLFNRILKKKRSASQPGPNKIPYRVYKACHYLASYLHRILNAIFRQGDVVPLCFRVNDGIMIPKVDSPDPSKIGDFRQIALLNVEGKLFWSLVADRLYDYLVVENAFVSPEIQKGSMRRMAGCWEHTAMMWSALKDAKKSKQSLAVLWLDLANAYGSVPHKLIVVALRRYQVPESWISLIMAYYDGMWGRTSSSGISSDWFLYERGIFAGCTISVILFIAAFNVLVEYIDAVNAPDVIPYEMSGGDRIERLRGFMDDVSLLTSSVPMTEILLKRTEVAVAWARMKLKPEKSRSLVIQNGRSVDEEPFSVGGVVIPSLQSKPLRTLGRDYTPAVNDLWAKDMLEKKVTSGLKQLNKSQAKGTMKLWAMHHILLQQVRWDLMVYDLPLTFIEGLEKQFNKRIRQWLGVARCLTDVALYAKGSPCPLPFVSLVHLFKSVKVTSHLQLLESSHSEVVQNVIPSRAPGAVKWRLSEVSKCTMGLESSLEVNVGALRVIEHRLECKDRIGFVSQGRMGLEYAGGDDGKLRADRTWRQSHADVVTEQTEEAYYVKAVMSSLEGTWTMWKNYTQRSLSWRSLVYGDTKLYRFCIGATFNTLASPSNLVRWKIDLGASCALCGGKGTIPHILSGCKQALAGGRYRYRHDNVLRVICHHISGFINNLPSADSVSRPRALVRTIQFVKEGSAPDRPVGTTQGKLGLLLQGKGWKFLSDLGKRLVFPAHIVVTSLRPDIVIYSDEAKTVIMIELTCPSEENFENQHLAKLARYTDLEADCISAGWKVHLFAVEVGARGYAAQSLSSCLKALGLKCRPLNKCVQTASDEALRTSFHIWVWRDSVEWCKVGFPEKKGRR